MGRVRLAVGLVLAWLLAARGAVAGGPTRKVQVETAPAGAAVYVGLKEAGAVGTTPLALDLPAGESTTVIVELAGYAPLIEAIDVPRGRGKPIQVHYDLVKAVGSLVIEGPGQARGAQVSVDGEARGEAPLTLELAAGPHQVKVARGPRVFYDDFVEIEDAGESTITPSAPAAPPVDDVAPAIQEDVVAAPAGAGAPRLEAAALVELGFRSFAYTNPRAGNLRSLTQGGEPLGGVGVEVWPLALAGVGVARRLSLEASAAVGVAQRVEGTSLQTAWQRYTAGLRYRQPLGGSLALIGLAGYTRDRVTFTGSDADLAMVPIVDYQSLRIGLDVSGDVGPIELYGGAETRVVLSGGGLAARFTKARASGYAAAVGARLRWGRLTARLEASLRRYIWTFESQPGDAFAADGADDQLADVTAAVGIAY